MCCEKLRDLADTVRAGCQLDSQYDPFKDIKKVFEELKNSQETCNGECEGPDVMFV